MVLLRGIFRYLQRAPTSNLAGSGSNGLKRLTVQQRAPTLQDFEVRAGGAQREQSVGVRRSDGTMGPRGGVGRPGRAEAR